MNPSQIEALKMLPIGSRHLMVLTTGLLVAVWSVIAFETPSRCHGRYRYPGWVVESSPDGVETLSAESSPTIDAPSMTDTQNVRGGGDTVGVDIWGNPVTDEELAEITAPRPPEPLAESESRRQDEASAKYTLGDFADSEWKIGVQWRDTKKIDVSWFRVKTNGSSQWGFNIGSSGQWKLDDGLFITISQDFFLGWNGKRLYSARIGDDPNYLEGIIRGWKPWEPASVMGRWQAIRLGVKRPNPPPWNDLEERLKREAEAEAAEEERSELAGDEP